MISIIVTVTILVIACIVGHFAATTLADPKMNILITWLGATVFAAFALFAVIFAVQPPVINLIMVLVQTSLVGGAVAAFVELVILMLAMRKSCPYPRIVIQMLCMLLIGCLCLGLLLWYQQEMFESGGNGSSLSLSTDFLADKKQMISEEINANNECPDPVRSQNPVARENKNMK